MDYSDYEIAVLIPCYNESVTIKKVIKDFRKEIPSAKVYVFDNNSSDDTKIIAESNGAIVYSVPFQGKGHVVRSMFEIVEADFYIMADGDDTYPATEVHKLLAPLISDEADMTTGDRLSNGTYAEENKRPLHSFGNNLVKGLINKLFQGNLKDIMTGYRGFNRKFVKNVPIMSAGFEIETEITLHSLQKFFRIQEIPIVYRDRPEGSFSKLNTFSDGSRVLKTIFLVFKDYKPFTFFGWIAFLLFIAGLGLGTPIIIHFIETGLVPRLPTAVLASALIILSMIAFSSGIILDTIVKQHRENYQLWVKKNS